MGDAVRRDDFIERHRVDGKHDCVEEKCAPHTRKPMAASTVLQIHSIISGTLSAAVRWDWINTNLARIAAHGAVVQRRVLHHGRSLRTGYVEGVALRSVVRRQGLGGRVMVALEGVIDRAYALGALSATYEGEGLYAARGWQPWQGRIHAFSPDSPDGVVHLPDEEVWLFLRPVSAGALDPAYELVFDWRDGDVL